MNSVNNNTNALLQQGMAHFQSGRLTQAEQAFRKALDQAPRDINALQLLGLVVFQQGRPLEGEKLLRKAIRKNGKIPKFHYNLGQMLEVQGKLKEALMAYRAAMKLDPKDEGTQVSLGVVYGKMGRLEEAMAACRTALKINPNNPHALANLGQFLWRSGKSREAIQVLEKALDLRPDFAQALSNLGAVLFSEGELDRAEEVLRRAYAINPRLPEVLSNLAGVLLRKSEDYDEALELSREAVNLTPDSPDALFNLGKALEYAEQWDEVFKCYSRALELQPGFTDVMDVLANANMVMGRFEEAKELYRQGLKNEPDSIRAYTLALSFEEREVVKGELGNIERKYEEAEDKEREKSKLSFALAKFLEKEGEYGKAFRYLEDGNRMRRKTYEYSMEDDRGFSSAIQSVFTNEFIREREGCGIPDETPIFILGMPRSGTTLTEQILASHPQVYGAGELPFMHRVLRDRCKPSPYRKYPEVVAGLNEGDLRLLGEQYLQGMRDCSSDFPRVTDKMPHNFRHLGMIGLLFPKAKVVHCMRDPMDNCLSIFKQNFKSLHKYAHDLEELGGHYLLYRDLMKHWHQVLPKGFIFDFQYEELVADQEAMSRRLLDFCGLEWDDNCLQFHKTERAVRTASQRQVRKGIYTDSVKLWQRYEQQLQPLIRVLQEGGAI